MSPARSISAQRLSTGTGLTTGAGPAVAMALLSAADATEADAASLGVAMLTSGFVVMPMANFTGNVYTRRLPAPAAIVAPVAVNTVPPAAPVSAPQLAAPVATHVAFPV